MTLRDDLLPVVDAIRQIPTDLGVRPTQAYVVVRTRTNRNAAPTESVTELTPRPRVEQSQDGRTVRLTPVSREFTPAQLNPAPASQQDVLYRLSGEVSGDYAFEAYLTGRPFRQTLVLRRLDRVQPFPTG